MKPVLVGYTNPTHQSDADEPERRTPVQLTEEAFVTHIHGVGATRSGKSKWIECFCRELVRQGIGFTLIDPQGKLAEDLVHYFAYSIPQQPIIYFDPSRTDYLVPFNPFRTAHAGYSEDIKRVVISTMVSKCVESILRVWGTDNSDETPRLERWLHCVMHLFAEGIITVNEALDILSWPHAALRAYAIERLGNEPVIQNEWRELQSYKRPQEFAAQIESARNRLFRFTLPAQIRRIMSLEDPTLDFRSIFEENAIVIANLKDSDFCSQEHGHLLGTLMINELWGAARRYGNNTRQPYFLIVDEVENFVTPDLKHILDRGAGKGLHLALFHQHLTQLREQDRWTYDSVMGNAKIKLVFGGLTKENALIMAEEMFTNQIDYDEAKIVIEQTKFWPKYGRDKVYMRTTGGSSGTVAGSGASLGSGAVSGSTWDYTYNLDTMRFSESASHAEHSTDFSASSSSQSWSEGEADIPIYRPEPFKEISSITPYTLEEQRNRLADRLMEQYQRHYFIKRPGQKTIPAATPFVREFRIFPENEQAYILNELIKPYARPVQEIDRLLDEHRRLLLEGKKTESESPSTDAKPDEPKDDEPQFWQPIE